MLSVQTCCLKIEQLCLRQSDFANDRWSSSEQLPLPRSTRNLQIGNPGCAGSMFKIRGKGNYLRRLYQNLATSSRTYSTNEKTGRRSTDHRPVFMGRTECSKAEGIRIIVRLRIFRADRREPLRNPSGISPGTGRARP